MSMSSISTLSLARQVRNNVRTTQSEMATLQQELSTGRKIDVAGSLGSGTASLLALRNSYSEIELFKTQMTAQAARLRTMQEAMTAVRNAATVVSDLALTASGLVSDTTSATIDDAAKNAISTITNMLNSSISGRFLFGGVAFDKQPVQGPDQALAAPSPFAGQTPTGLVTAAIAALPPVTDAASADAMVNAMDTWFETNFNDIFFHGSTDPVVARAEGSVTITYGATAGDPAVKDMMKGLYLLATIPSESVNDAAYQQVAKRAWGLISSSTAQMTETQSKLGLEEQQVELTQSRLDVQKTLVNGQIVVLEEADPYEATLRLDVLKNQLEATFAMTASIGRLSLVNYL